MGGFAPQYQSEEAAREYLAPPIVKDHEDHKNRNGHAYPHDGV